MFLTSGWPNGIGVLKPGYEIILSGLIFESLFKLPTGIVTEIIIHKDYTNFKKTV